MKKSYYFKHDSNARNDNKLINVRLKHGMMGYGIYFGIIEILRESSGYKILCDFKALSYDLREKQSIIEDIVRNFGLFKTNKTHLWSTSLMGRMKEYEKILRNNKKAAIIKWEKTRKEGSIRTPSKEYTADEIKNMH